MGWSAGTYTRARNWVQDKINLINPQAALFDQEDDATALGLNNCITKDGLNKPSATMDWNGQRLTALADATAATDAVNRQFGDARYSQLIAIAKRKASDTARASTTTVTDDPDLIAALLTNSFYGFDLYLKVLPDAGGLKCLMNYSASFTSATSFEAGHGVLNAVNTTTPLQTIGGTTLFAGTGSINDWYRIWGTIATTAAGNLSLQWAQSSSNVANSTLKAGSFMIVTKLG